MKRLAENEIIEKLKALDIRPLKINCRAVEPYLPFEGFTSKYRPDALIDITWKTKTFQFVAEIKTVSTPKLIDEAIWQLTYYLEYFKNRRSTESFYPLIIAPYLNDSLLADLTAREISGIDLSGNLSLIVQDQLLFSRTGRPNKYPSGDPIKNVYRGTSSIVARVMLSKQEYNSVNEVLDELTERGGKTSLGTVSKVLKALEDELIISRSGGVRLIDPKTLLLKLRENYRAPRPVRKTIGKVSDLPATLATISQNCDKNELLCAIDEPRRYAIFPTVGAPTRVYVEDTEESLEEIEFEETDRFANIELIETSESPVYFDRRWELADGAYYTAPLQSYLDLTTGGKREFDTAEQIATGLLNFSY